MSNRTSKTLPPPAAREFDESVDEDLEDEEGEASFADEEDDDDGLWDSPDDVDDEDEEDDDEPEASGRDTEIAAVSETLGSSLAEDYCHAFTELVMDTSVLSLAVDEIEPDPDQPRLEVDDELAASIAGQGVLQPIVVTINPGVDNPRYRIVDGERRWRGAQKAGLIRLPARIARNIVDAGDRLLRQVTFNEGKRLAPMEEAKAWARIMAAKGWNIQQLAAALGRAKSTVSDRLALLDAPAPFQDLLTKGLLSAASGPVLREYRDVPERILKAAVKNLVEDEYEGWGKFTVAGLPVPIDDVKRDLENEIVPPSWGNDYLVPLDKALATKYSGAVVTIKGHKYAADVAAYRALEEQRRTERAETRDTPAKHEPSKYELEQRERQRKERIAHEKKRALRRAQFDTLAPKLPATLDGNWALLVITWLTKEIQQDYQRVFLKALGVEPTKRPGNFGGFDFQGTVIREATKLATPARVKFALALLLAHDLNVSPYDLGGPDRFTAAAKLLKIDLAKVKAPDPAKAEKKPAAKPAAKKTKKGGRR